MFPLFIWFTGLVLLALLLGRAFTGGVLSKYPFFYVYVCFVLITSSWLFAVYLSRSTYYPRLYWYVEFFGAVLGCVVVWEIYRGAFRQFPGAARMARNVLALIAIVVLTKAIADGPSGSNWLPAATMIELERDLRAVQAGVLIGLVTVIAYYRVPLGSNLWGMMSGYGLLIGSNMITLTLRALLGDTFQRAWFYLQPLSYLTVLCIWCVTLWSYKSIPQPKLNPRVERDYQLLVDTTARALLEARIYLRKAMRL
jgi:hypothetical protein